MTLSTVLPTIASSDDSTMAASQRSGRSVQKLVPIGGRFFGGIIPLLGPGRHARTGDGGRVGRKRRVGESTTRGKVAMKWRRGAQFSRVLTACRCGVMV